MPISIAVIYHSGFGHTKVVAQAVAEGANQIEGAAARLVDVESINGDFNQFDQDDALIFGAPTYMGSISAPMKAFMDASAEKWFMGAWRDKIAAGFTNAGNPSGDKLRSLETIQGFAMQHGMIWVGYHEKAGINPETGEADNTNRDGHWVGLATRAIDAPPSETPDQDDLRTARFFGQRIAQATKRWSQT